MSIWKDTCLIFHFVADAIRRFGILCKWFVLVIIFRVGKRRLLGFGFFFLLLFLLLFGIALKGNKEIVTVPSS